MVATEIIFPAALIFFLIINFRYAEVGLLHLSNWGPRVSTETAEKRHAVTVNAYFSCDRAVLLSSLT